MLCICTIFCISKIYHVDLNCFYIIKTVPERACVRHFGDGSTSGLTNSLKAPCLYLAPPGSISAGSCKCRATNRVRIPSSRLSRYMQGSPDRQRKTLDRMAKSGKPEIERQANWGMSQETFSWKFHLLASPLLSLFCLQALYKLPRCCFAIRW